MEKTEKRPNKPLYIALSILIACALWLYVRSVDTRDRTSTISRIPVTFVGEDVLNNNGLVLTGDRNQTVELTVQGRWNVISQLRRDNIKVQVDLSRVKSVMDSSLAYEIILPGNVSAGSVSIVDRAPFYVPVKVEERDSASVQVTGTFLGSVAEGYQAGEFSFAPGIIEISGLKEDVHRVKGARVVLERDGLSETVRQDMSYVLIDEDGNPVRSDTLKAVPATVNVTMPVGKVAELPLTVDFIPGGGLSGGSDKRLEWSVRPASIIIAGSESDLAAYGGALSVGTVDLAKVTKPLGQSQEFEFTILLSDEVKNITGVQTATVTVKVRDLKEREFTIERFTLKNPNNINVQVLTQSVNVRVRGTAEALDQIIPENINATVDLSDPSAIPDEISEVPVKITLTEASGAGVVDTGYTVFIRARGAGQVGGGT